MEVVTTAKYGLLVDRRSYGWILTTTIGPFFLMAPFVLMAESLVGPGGRFNEPFFEATGYSNYLGWLIIPLIALNTMNTVFSNVSQKLHHEKTAGTLERVLVSIQFPSSLLIGRCISHGTFLVWFVGMLAGLSFMFLGLEVHVDAVSAVVVIAAHLLAVYGMAFAFASMFLWIEDAFIVQTALSRVVFGLFTGATFPLSIYPDWVEWLARLIPFTWAFDLERRAFLRAESLSSILPDLSILLGLTLAWWIVGYGCFRLMLNYSKRNGRLGMLLMTDLRRPAPSRSREFAAAVFVIARNELHLQTRYRTKFLLDLFSPVLALTPIMLTAYFLTSGRESGNLAQSVRLPDHFTFIMLGYMAFAALGVGNPIMHYTGAAWTMRMLQETGVLERNLLAPMAREALVIGAGLYYAVLYLFHVAYVLAASLLFLDLDLNVTASGVAVAGGLLIAMSLMSILLGFLMAAVSLVMRDGSVALLVIHRPFLLLTGAYFLVELLPQPFRLLAMVNPLAYAIDAFRGSLSSSTLLLPLPVECGIVAGSTVLIGVVGVWVFRRILDRQLRTGELSLY